MTCHEESLTVVELLIRTALGLRDAYIIVDREIWTVLLETLPGFMGKQVWISPDRPDEVIPKIYWAFGTEPNRVLGAERLALAVAWRRSGWATVMWFALSMRLMSAIKSTKNAP